MQLWLVLRQLNFYISIHENTASNNYENHHIASKYSYCQKDINPDSSSIGLIR